MPSSSEPRRDLPVPVRVELTRPDGSVTQEYAVNLSGGGACLQVRAPLEPGDRVSIAFGLPPDGGEAVLAATVVWCSPLEERGDHARFCELGVRFDHVDDSLRERLIRFASQPVDRRR